MKTITSLFQKGTPPRVIAEGWVVCCLLLFSLLPIALESTPLARSLYLLLIPVVCAVVCALRLRPFPGPVGKSVLKEIGFALALCLGILGIGFCVFSSLSQVDSLLYAGTGGIIFFTIMAASEYLGARLLIWAWQRWNYLRRQRYVWALTHAILSVVGGLGLLVLLATMLYLVKLLNNDIWEIPSGSVFAQAVFWMTVLLLLTFILFIGGLVLLFPPILLFSFLVARKMTARLENLALITRSLRQGSLASRVEIKGEDEIAQLQADFNAMAADLEKSVQSFQKEKDKVWELMETRREFVNGVTHELRNPAAIIQGYCDSLKRDWQNRPPEEVEKDLSTIQYEIARQQAIMNDLLTASQMEVGHLAIHSENVNVSELALRLVETFSPLAWGSMRIQMTFVAPSDEIMILADPLRLEQVLVNLIQNAIRHTSPGGLVTLEIHKLADYVSIEVEDTGEGITPEDLPYIWNKYYRGGSPQAHSQNGIGLGLALVKELTEAMGGKVSAESCPGQGSSFKVHLPGALAMTHETKFLSQ